MNDYTTKYDDLFWSRVAVDEAEFACWEWKSGKNGGGYGTANFRRKREGAHRIAYILAFGEIPNGLHVLHHCDNPACCNPNHLFLGTALDNARDRDAKGRKVNGDHKGEKHGRHKLSDAQVSDILQRYDAANGKYGIQVLLAKEFGVGVAHIWMIVHRRSRR